MREQAASERPPEVEQTVDFFKVANFMLQYTVPNSADKATIDEVAKIGVAAGKSWEPAEMEPAIRRAIEDGIVDAWALIKDTEKSVKDAGKFFGTREIIGTDYLNRTMGVYMGIYGNVKQQAVYQTWPTDSDGNPLNTNTNSYTITFAPGQLPEAKYFWSVTMYNLPGRFLVANPINRYSIGSQTLGLQQEADGSVVIYVQKNSPGKDKESNWLPAPDGPFFAVLRIYGPGEAEQSGKWVAPTAVRVT